MAILFRFLNAISNGFFVRAFVNVNVQSVCRSSRPTLDFHRILKPIDIDHSKRISNKNGKLLLFFKFWTLKHYIYKSYNKMNNSWSLSNNIMQQISASVSFSRSWTFHYKPIAIQHIQNGKRDATNFTRTFVRKVFYSSFSSFLFANVQMIFVIFNNNENEWKKTI